MCIFSEKENIPILFSFVRVEGWRDGKEEGARRKRQGGGEGGGREGGGESEGDTEYWGEMGQEREMAGDMLCFYFI